VVPVARKNPVGRFDESLHRTKATGPSNERSDNRQTGGDFDGRDPGARDTPVNVADVDRCHPLLRRHCREQVRDALV
jgi:hypothetical protein